KSVTCAIARRTIRPLPRSSVRIAVESPRTRASLGSVAGVAPRRGSRRSRGWRLSSSRSDGAGKALFGPRVTGSAGYTAILQRLPACGAPRYDRKTEEDSMRATLCVVLSLCACNDKGSDSNGGSDGDDSGSGGTPVDLDADGYSPPDDCDDNDAEIHPDASEVCDGADNDCDGTTDVGATDAVEYWADGDGDGYGAGTSELSCSPVDGSVDNGDD